MQEFSFCEEYIIGAEKMIPSEMERLFCGILCRCPNLKRLYVAVQRLPITPSSTSKCLLFLQLSTLVFLENLWLRQIESPLLQLLSAEEGVSFWDLYTALTKLQSLKSISLSGLCLTSPSEPNTNGVLSASLKSVSLTNISNKPPIDDALISWLIEPRGGFNTSTIDIDFNLLPVDVFPLEKKQLLMMSVVKLQVRTKHHDVDELMRTVQRSQSLS